MSNSNYCFSYLYYQELRFINFFSQDAAQSTSIKWEAKETPNSRSQKICYQNTNEHRCEFCGKLFTSEKYLGTHYESHFIETSSIELKTKYFICKICGKKSSSELYLNYHELKCKQ